MADPRQSQFVSRWKADGRCPFKDPSPGTPDNSSPAPGPGVLADFCSERPPGLIEGRAVFVDQKVFDDLAGGGVDDDD